MCWGIILQISGGCLIGFRTWALEQNHISEDKGLFHLPRFPSHCPGRSEKGDKVNRAHLKRRVTERGVFALACQYIVSPRGWTGNRTVTQMRHPLLVEGRPKCARQSLASTLSAPRVAATSYCDPGRHANVITPVCLPPFQCAQVKREVEKRLTKENFVTLKLQ